MQNRLRSWVLWSGFLSFAGMILKNEYDIDLEQYDVMAEALLTLLVGLGLINNPKDKSKL